MALALFLHILGASLIGLLAGRLYYEAVSKGGSSPKLMRWTGLALMVLMTTCIWLRIVVARGATPNALNLSSRVEYIFSLVSCALLLAVAAGGAARIIRLVLLERRRDERRRQTIMEIRRRDEEGEGTLSGKTFMDLEAQVEEVCRHHAGPGARLVFQFLDPLPMPLTSGWLTPKIRCPLDMGSGEGGMHLELAALREVELLRKRVLAWRIALVALLVINPFGGWFARGILLSLDQEADEATKELGEGAREDLLALLSYEEWSAGEGRGSGVLGSGDKAITLRKLRIEGMTSSLARTGLVGAIVSLACWGAGVMALGPVGFDSIFGIVSLKPPAYLAVETSQPGLVVQAIPGAGMWEQDAGKGLARSVRDGVFADARDADPGLATLWFHGPILGVPTIHARIEAIPGARPGNSTPMLYLSALDVNRAGPVVASYTVLWCRFIPLPKGTQDLTIPLDTANSSVDAGIYLPQGWAIKVTNIRADSAMDLKDDPADVRRTVKDIVAYDAQWSAQRLTLNDALDWAPGNLVRQARK